MQVAYMTNKLFADGSEELRIKIGKQITAQTVLKAQKTKRLNKIRKQVHREQIIKELNELRFDDTNYFRRKRILEFELDLRNLKNVRRSADRARQNLYDICKCNAFDFFVTFTCDKQKLDRLDDKKVKRKFSQWANDIRKRFPKMYYVATPEYHAAGGLHFHLLIGGVTFEQLQCIAAVSKRGRLIVKNGKQIYNVNAWRWGHSTLSIIENTEAAKHYICKYITKQHADDRFFKKRRYYVSQNINRPVVTKWTESPEDCLQGIDLNVYLVAYCDGQKGFAVLTADGSGVVDFAKNTPQTQSGLAGLRCLANSTSTKQTKHYDPLPKDYDPKLYDYDVLLGWCPVT